MKPVDLIIFDLDGTLADTKQDVANSINFTLKELGLRERNLEEVYSFIGTGREDLLIRSLGSKNEELLDKAISIFREHYGKHMTDNSRLYPGVNEMLEYFNDKRKVIVTNRKHYSAIKLLEAFNVLSYFDEVKGGDNDNYKKPSSSPLNDVINNFNINKKKSIIIGDMDLDILAGKEAGIMTCAVTYGIGNPDTVIRLRPDFIIDAIWELKDMIC